MCRGLFLIFIVANFFGPPSRTVAMNQPKMFSFCWRKTFSTDTASSLPAFESDRLLRTIEAIASHREESSTLGTWNAQQRQTLMVRCAFLGGSCLSIWTQFWLDKLDNQGTLIWVLSLNVKGHLRRKTKSWNGIVHVKGIWKFLSNLNFAKCRWKREKERKEFLTWWNICIQHSINCARVQTLESILNQRWRFLGRYIL